MKIVTHMLDFADVTILRGKAFIDNWTQRGWVVEHVEGTKFLATRVVKTL